MKLAYRKGQVLTKLWTGYKIIYALHMFASSVDLIQLYF